MVELTITNKQDQKHYIVVSASYKLVDDNVESKVLQVHIVRTRNIGGTPVKVTREYPKNIEFSECLQKIYIVCELDDELFNLCSEHQ